MDHRNKKQILFSSEDIRAYLDEDDVENMEEIPDYESNDGILDSDSESKSSNISGVDLFEKYYELEKANGQVPDGTNIPNQANDNSNGSVMVDIEHEGDKEDDFIIGSDVNYQENGIGIGNPDMEEDSLQVLESESSESDDNDPGPIPAKRRKSVSNKARKSKGKPKTSVWDLFSTIRNANGKITSNKCKSCQAKVSPQACRMNNHLEKCKGRKTDPGAHVQTLSGLSPASTGSGKSGSRSSQASQGDITKWIDRTSVSEKEALDLKIGKCIFGANLPFNLVENKLFRSMVKALKPSYEPPTVRVLSTTILDKVYGEAVQLMKADLGGTPDAPTKVTLLQDGWSTNQNQPVIAHSVTTGKSAYFIDAEATGTNTKTSEFCFELFVKAMENITRSLNCQVIACVTDNTESMVKLRRIINARFPDIFVAGCQSHILNLLGSELASKTIIAQVVEVQKYFKFHHYESAVLKEKKGTRPEIPGSTRWNSQLDALRSFLKNQTKYVEISRLPKSRISDDFKRIITSPRVYNDVIEQVELLEPVCISLDKLQSSSSTIADAMKQWIILESKLGTSQNAGTAFKRRKGQAVSAIMIVAYMLHPIYRGQDLSSQDREVGNEYLQARSPLFFAAAVSLLTEDKSFYPKSHLNRDGIKFINSVSWWKSLQGQGQVTNELIEFASTILSIPSSSADLERHFSTMGDILSKKRNRLGVEKCKKLCTIYRAFRDIDYEDDDD